MTNISARIFGCETSPIPKVHRWLLRRPRFHLHFTPTGSSWLNMVERFFARITTEAIRRGSFSSVRQLQAAIDAYLAEHNKEPKPFICALHSLYILLSMSYTSLIAENSELHNSSHDIKERCKASDGIGKVGSLNY